MINVTNAAVAGYKLGLVGEIRGQFPTSAVHVCSQKAFLLQLEATLTFKCTLPPSLTGREACSITGPSGGRTEGCKKCLLQKEGEYGAV